MKKVIVVLLTLIVIATQGFAVEIEGSDIRAKAMAKLSVLRAKSTTYAGFVLATKSEIQGYLTDYPGATVFSASDRTKMGAVNGKATPAYDGPNDLAAEVLTQYPNVNRE